VEQVSQLQMLQEVGTGGAEKFAWCSQLKVLTKVLETYISVRNLFQ